MLYDPQTKRWRGLPARSGFIWDGNRRFRSASVKALVSLDFVNGFYTVNGVAQTASQVIDQPSRITAGSGLQILGGSVPTSVVNYLGGTATLLQAGSWSVIMKINMNTTFISVLPVALYDASFNAQVTAGLKRSGGNPAFGSLFEFNGGAFQVEVDATNFINAQLCTVGATRTDTHRAVTQNGDPVDPGFGFDNTNDPIAPFNITQSMLVCYESVGAKGFLRRLDIYAPVNDTQLALLTRS